MRSIKGTINNVELLGWLGADPELRFTPSGIKFCRFRIATKRFGAQDETGNRMVETEWVNVECWDRLADLCSTYLHKGSRAMISGSLRSETWTDRESGQQRWRTFVRAENILFLDARPEQQVEATEETAETEEVPF